MPPIRAPRTFLAILEEAIRHIEACRTNDAVSKEDVLDDMETRLSVAMQKMLATPTVTSFCVFHPRK